jgi:putative addiction module component (TIGR02574 family)
VTQSFSDVAIKQLSVAERLDLIGELWDSIGESVEELPTPAWHIAEVERRLATADADPAAAIPMEEVIQRLRNNK